MSTPGGASSGAPKSTTLLKAGCKSEASNKTKHLPEVVQPNWKRFLKHTTNKYTDYKVTHDGKNGYLLQATKPGNVPSSYAIYYKEVDEFGKTLRAYKDTYDNNGNFIHRKEK